MVRKHGGLVKPSFIHVVNPDAVTLQQFNECLNQSFVIKGALMPDAHQGYVAPIGAVLVTKNVLVPAWVGFDIGCGMTAVKLSSSITRKWVEKNAPAIFTHVQQHVPMGLGEVNQASDITQESKHELEKLIQQFAKGPFDKNVLHFLKTASIRHLGTLGHGNHFLELGYSEKNDSCWLVVHSGSRGVGHHCAETYMKKASPQTQGTEATFPIEADSVMGKEYQNLLHFCLEFALLNRMEIIRQTIKGIEEVLGKGVSWKLWVNKNHNHAVPDQKKKGLFIHRKGATPAGKGERGVIPANMRDGSFLVKGLGNAQFLNSSSHGAGRLMGRAEAKEKLTMSDFQTTMKGITGTVSESTLDEAPMAYKNIFDVMNAQKKSVKAVDRIIPLINWKGEKRGLR